MGTTDSSCPHGHCDSQGSSIEDDVTMLQMGMENKARNPSAKGSENASMSQAVTTKHGRSFNRFSQSSLAKSNRTSGSKHGRSFNRFKRSRLAKSNQTSDFKHGRSFNRLSQSRLAKSNHTSGFKHGRSFNRSSRSRRALLDRGNHSRGLKRSRRSRWALLEKGNHTHGRGLHQEDAINTAAVRKECIALDVSGAAYFGFPPGTLPAGFTLVQQYIYHSASGPDVDRAGLVANNGDCILAFKGSSHDEDFENNGNWAPEDKWGIHGVHAGLVTELEPLVREMDFDQIRTVCTNSLTVAGHSLGGGLAQVFSLAVNNDGMPQAAGLKVDFLYTFGAMAVTLGKKGNAKSSDGCFAGAQYWYAEKEGDYYWVDVVQSPLIGGHALVPVNSTKVYVFSDGEEETFPCGTPIPQSGSLLLKHGFDKWSNLHLGYPAYMGCP